MDPPAVSPVEPFPLFAPETVPEETADENTPGNRSSLIPPYSLHNTNRPNGKANRDSYRSTRPVSSVSGSNFQIRLEDHVETPTDSSAYLWAESVIVKDWTVIEGALGSIGAFVIWNCRVETLSGGHLEIRKRYVYGSGWF
jgi:hypothetical protein